MNVSIRQLRVFVSAARHGSFGKAAREMQLTPPAVSMQIRELEAQVGLSLFERSGRKVTLTLTGECLLVYATRILSTLKDAEDAVARFRNLRTGRLSLGMVSTATYLLPRLLRRFRAEHSGIEVRLSVGNRGQLVELMRRNEVDLAVMGGPPHELATCAEPFAAHPRAVVVAPGHPLASGDHVPAQELSRFAFIAREPGSGTRAVMERYFEDWGITPHIGMELTSNETIKQTVMADLGIGFLSVHTIGPELRQNLLALANVEGLPVVGRWYVVNNLAKLLSPVAEAFRDFVLQEREALLAAEFGEFPKTT